MLRMLEPTVTSCQEPLVTSVRRTIEPLVMGDETQHRADFARRLNELLDGLGVPAKGAGRQVAVGKMFGVSQKGARKWLEGEAIPEAWRIPVMAERLHSTEEYLQWGRGPQRTGGVAESPGRPYQNGRETIYLERLNVGGSMGPGIVAPDHVEVVESIRVHLPELRREVHFTAPQNLRIITGYGDSMQPTFTDGDPLLVDTGVTEIKLDAVYVLEKENGTPQPDVYIKRLQRRPDGALLMISDNKNYEPYVIRDAERMQFKICGRVLLAWNSRRL